MKEIIRIRLATIVMRIHRWLFPIQYFNASELMHGSPIRAVDGKWVLVLDKEKDQDEGS
jgi:hypothetical protein